MPVHTSSEYNTQNTHSFIHSFIHSDHFCSAPSSQLLLRSAPDYSTDTASEFHAEAHRQLQVKEWPKVPTWRLERESNSRSSGRKSSSQPRCHHINTCLYDPTGPYIHLDHHNIAKVEL